MQKTDRNEQSAWRTFAAIALASAISVACSTNRNPGNGQPTGTTAPATSPASTPGSSSGTTGNPPMASAVVSPNPGRAVGGTTPSTDALAVAAANRAYRAPRVLGTINPSGTQQDPNAGATNGYLNPPALYANPQQTVNSTISSVPTQVITTGAEDDGCGYLITGGGTCAVRGIGVEQLW